MSVEESALTAISRMLVPIKMGKFNEIHPTVRFIPFKGGPIGEVELGDCNRIEEGVRIMVGPGGFKCGDYNVIHNRCTLGGPGPIVMGHNCWFGQEVWLDSTGRLTLGNGVRIGLRSHVWSHMASGEQIEGWKAIFNPTILEDDVWLVGDDVHVASGVRMGSRSAALAHSTVTRDTKSDTVYAGTPAREVSFRLRNNLPDCVKWNMMVEWLKEFSKQNGCSLDFLGQMAMLYTQNDSVIIGREFSHFEPNRTYFDLTTKTYTKKLSQLERDLMHFLYGNKARFLPVTELQ